MACGGENGTNGSHLVVFSEDIVFARYFVATHCPTHLPLSHCIGVLVVLAMPIKNYLKWQENQLAIQHTVGRMNYFEYSSYRFVENHVQVALIILEIRMLN